MARVHHGRCLFLSVGAFTGLFVALGAAGRLATVCGRPARIDARVPGTIAPWLEPRHEQSHVDAGFVDRWQAAEHDDLRTFGATAGATGRAVPGIVPAVIGFAGRLRCGAFLPFAGSGRRFLFGLAACTASPVASPEQPAATNHNQPPTTNPAVRRQRVAAPRCATCLRCCLVAMARHRPRPRGVPAQ